VPFAATNGRETGNRQECCARGGRCCAVGFKDRIHGLRVCVLSSPVNCQGACGENGREWAWGRRHCGSVAGGRRPGVPGLTLQVGASEREGTVSILAGHRDASASVRTGRGYRVM